MNVVMSEVISAGTVNSSRYSARCSPVSWAARVSEQSPQDGQVLVVLDPVAQHFQPDHVDGPFEHRRVGRPSAAASGG